jgi:hypothetical protein
MLGRSNLKFASIALAFLAALSLASTAVAGGFQLSIEVPPASTDAELKDAVLLVRTYGCHRPAEAVVTATAEGLVGGERKSVPVKLTPASTGSYAITRQWPSEGVWALAITINYSGLTTSALVKLGPGGKVYSDTRLDMGSAKGPYVLSVRRSLKAAEIDSALRPATASLGEPPESSETISPASRTGAWLVAGLGALFSLGGVVRLKRRLKA